ncbi:hypothetical protein LCGC14_3160060 [marine sediment metagenome]|uniref:DUF3179 domain-containing protein n=1 Tax=marine sediment metagenome TaxID=412755 RepID=A0A0F8WFL8_9ZZZZ
MCGSGIAYEGKINGEEVEFGTSGKLYNSNLVMYDRKTDSYWTQIDGLAIVGELTGTRLTPISIDTVVWQDWKEAHSDSEVLSQDTGFRRAYGTDPYGNYNKKNCKEIQEERLRFSRRISMKKNKKQKQVKRNY